MSGTPGTQESPHSAAESDVQAKNGQRYPETGNGRTEGDCESVHKLNDEQQRLIRLGEAVEQTVGRPRDPEADDAQWGWSNGWNACRDAIYAEADNVNPPTEGAT